MLEVLSTFNIVRRLLTIWRFWKLNFFWNKINMSMKILGLGVFELLGHEYLYQMLILWMKLKECCIYL